MPKSIGWVLYKTLLKIHLLLFYIGRTQDQYSQIYLGISGEDINQIRGPVFTMPLDRLPDELLLCITSFMPKLQDIDSLSRTRRRTYHTLNRFLYELSIQRDERFKCYGNALSGMLLHAQLLLEKGEGSPEIALYVASIEHRYSFMRTLILNGADVNARISNGFTPLHAAVCSANPFHKNEPSVRILLDNKVDPYERTEGVFDGYNALRLAPENGKWGVVGMLLDIGMDIESPTT